MIPEEDIMTWEIALQKAKELKKNNTVKISSWSSVTCKTWTDRCGTEPENNFVESWNFAIEKDSEDTNNYNLIAYITRDRLDCEDTHNVFTWPLVRNESENFLAILIQKFYTHKARFSAYG